MKGRVRKENEICSPFIPPFFSVRGNLQFCRKEVSGDYCLKLYLKSKPLE